MAPAYFRIRELLESRQMSQSALSRTSGVSLPRINELCSGRAKGISLDVASKLAAALGVSPGELIGPVRGAKHRS